MVLQGDSVLLQSGTLVLQGRSLVFFIWFSKTVTGSLVLFPGTLRRSPVMQDGSLVLQGIILVLFYDSPRQFSGSPGQFPNSL